MYPARCPASGPVPSPDYANAPRNGEGPASGPLPFLPADIAELQIRIEAVDARLLHLEHEQGLATAKPDKPTGRTFDVIETDSVLVDLEELLDAMQIIHASFHQCDDLEGIRRVCRALDPVIEMTVAETAKLRASLFGQEN